MGTARQAGYNTVDKMFTTADKITEVALHSAPEALGNKAIDIGSTVVGFGQGIVDGLNERINWAMMLEGLVMTLGSIALMLGIGATAMFLVASVMLWKED